MQTESLEDLLRSFQTSSKTEKPRKKTENDEALDEFLAEYEKPKKTVKLSTSIDVDKLLQKSAVLKPEFESLHSIPPYEVAQRKLRKLKKIEESKQLKNWYGLPSTEMTEEIKNELEVLKMRSVLDPKRFYKKNDLSVLPKYFQIGKVVSSPLDYYNERGMKKEKKKTLVDQLLAEAEFNKLNKRRYKEIIEQKGRGKFNRKKRKNK